MNTGSVFRAPVSTARVHGLFTARVQHVMASKYNVSRVNSIKSDKHVSVRLLLLPEDVGANVHRS